MKVATLAAADLATQPLAAHLDIQHAEHLVFVILLQIMYAAPGVFGDLALMDTELELEHVLLDPHVQFLKQRHAQFGIAHKALTPTVLAVL